MDNEDAPASESQTAAPLPTDPNPCIANDSRRPNLPDGFHPLADNYVACERVGGMILFGVLLIGSMVGTGAKLLFGGIDFWFFAILVGSAVVLGLTLWSALFWPVIQARHICWKLDQFGLEYHAGVLWKTRTSVPLARVQHADVSQGPIQRAYGLGSLVVHTAGTSDSSVQVAGLDHTVALDLRDLLVRQEKAGADVSG